MTLSTEADIHCQALVKGHKGGEDTKNWSYLLPSQSLVNMNNPAETQAHYCPAAAYGSSEEQ